jgi:hypothetical protein
VSHTNMAAGASHTPPHLSLIPIEVLHGFIDLLSHPHARDTIIGTSAVNALLTAELVEQVTRIADWHKRVGHFFIGDDVVREAAAPAASSTKPAPYGGSAPAAAPAPAPAPAPSAGATAAAPAHAAQPHAVPGAASATLTPFLTGLNSMVLNQLALRDALIAGLRADLTTAQSDVADLKTKHAVMMTQIGGLQTQVNGQIDLTTKQGTTLAQATDDITGLQSLQGDLTNRTSALHTDVASARGQLEPLMSRVDQMTVDLARHDQMIVEIARDAAEAAANPTTEVLIVEERTVEPPDQSEDTPEDNPRGRRPGRRP